MIKLKQRLSLKKLLVILLIIFCFSTINISAEDNSKNQPDPNATGAICDTNMTIAECQEFMQNNGYAEPEDKQDLKKYEELDLFSQWIVTDKKKEINKWYIQYNLDSFSAPSGAGAGMDIIKNMLMGITTFVAVFLNIISFIIYYLIMGLASFIDSATLQNVINNFKNFVLYDIFNFKSDSGLGVRVLFIFAFIIGLIRLVKLLTQNSNAGLVDMFKVLLATVVIAFASYTSIQQHTYLDKSIDKIVNKITKTIVSDKELIKITGSNDEFSLKNSIYEMMALQPFALANFGKTAKDIHADENLKDRVVKLMKNKDNYADTEAKEKKNPYVISKENNVVFTLLWHFLNGVIIILQNFAIGIIEAVMLIFLLIFKVIKALVIPFSGFLILKEYKERGLSAITYVYSNSFMWTLVSVLGTVAVALVNTTIMTIYGQLIVENIVFAILFSIGLALVGFLLAKNYKKVMAVFGSQFDMLKSAFKGESATDSLKKATKPLSDLATAIKEDIAKPFKSNGSEDEIESDEEEREDDEKELTEEEKPKGVDGDVDTDGLGDEDPKEDEENPIEKNDLEETGDEESSDEGSEDDSEVISGVDESLFEDNEEFDSSSIEQPDVDYNDKKGETSDESK